MSNEDIKKAIVDMNAEKISLETLQIMVLYIPQPEEVGHSIFKSGCASV